MENDLLKFCRYYHGGDKNPYEGKDQNKAMFYCYEKAWIDLMTQSNENAEAERGINNLISEYLTDYLNNGLVNFSFNDNVPLTLKALLFNRYQHWNMGGIDGFKDFYLNEYLGG